MSHTTRRTHHKVWSDPSLPEWQQNRGPRLGNLRHQTAALKVRDRRHERARLKRTTLNECPD